MFTIDSDYIRAAGDEAVLGSPESALKQLGAQGFPLYMSYAFLKTAQDTDSIILSRLPGKVGNDLIEAGYDLKGFHIKAKSCNWGPMAGFICQLPIFNKLGVKKISYNTKEIAHYLHCMHTFNGTKRAIGYLNEKRAEYIEIAMQDLSGEALKAELIDITEDFDSRVLMELKKARDNEATEGDWSGENELATQLPFIPLKREFADIEVVTDLKGVKSAIDLSGNLNLIYGIAENVTDEINPDNNDPTVKIEFLLKRIGDSKFYDIYHGRVNYTEPDKEKFAKSFNGGVITDQVAAKVRTKYADYLDDIFRLCTDDVVDVTDGGMLTAIRGIEFALPPAEGPLKFHKVNGIVNPFPPFPAGPEYYKNAVSGDYDLFAIWPNMDLHQDELIRQSEISIGQTNRLGGKIFTTYFGYKCNFAIEFIPGFNELGPNGGVMKESAEFGNMNSLGHAVSGLLNSNAASLITEFNGEFSTANKGFHSDEGGRPGIMEVEFPIAVYLPQQFFSKALDNLEADPATHRIRAISHRAGVETYCGLLKSTEDLVAFIWESMYYDYRVFMHYRWMIHLIYDFLHPDEREGYLTNVITNHLERILKDNPDFKKDSEDKFDDFKAMDANRAVIDAQMDTDREVFETTLRELMTPPGDHGFFNQFCELMLIYAFTPEMKSFPRKQEVEACMDNNKIQK